MIQNNGKHTSYLRYPKRWRELDPQLFDTLKNIYESDRSVDAVAKSGALDAIFSSNVLNHGKEHHSARNTLRAEWFETVLHELSGCDLVFADPDNGLIDDNPKRRNKLKFGKQMPLGEVLAFAQDRTAIVYHHNSRYPGGHELEIRHWFEKLGTGTIAIRANAYSCRTFFILNPSNQIERRAEDFAARWAEHRVSLFRH
ncbi:hypothetical protein [Parasphingorhabdus sp.]|uniref:hypothetical protein n=1 Tax=Parasphingorhabdus sp. TaxID=2709688 RepID=UPI003002BB9D